MKTHELKTLPLFFEAMWNDEKSFELRKNDRDFQVGDRLQLREWSEADGYTGRGLTCLVKYILDNSLVSGLYPNFVVMSLGVERTQELI